MDRAYGEAVDDATITSTVKSKLLWSRYADGLSANVDTKRGKVILTGTANSEEAKDAAGSLARNTRGVHAVNNQLMVGPPNPRRQEYDQRHHRRLDHHQGEVNLHGFQQRERVGYRGQHQ